MFTSDVLAFNLNRCTNKRRRVIKARTNALVVWPERLWVRLVQLGLVGEFVSSHSIAAALQDVVLVLVIGMAMRLCMALVLRSYLTSLPFAR